MIQCAQLRTPVNIVHHWQHVATAEQVYQVIYQTPLQVKLGQNGQKMTVLQEDLIASSLGSGQQQCVHLYVFFQGWVGRLHQPLEEVQNERMLQLMAGCYLENKQVHVYNVQFHSELIYSTYYQYRTRSPLGPACISGVDLHAPHVIGDHHLPGSTCTYGNSLLSKDLISLWFLLPA